jgi:LacI family transcriptional regulator
MTEKLLNENPDLRGLYIAGGGITGAIAALRSTGRAGSLVVVGYELMDTTPLGAGRRHADLCHLASPRPHRAETLAGMVRAVSAPREASNVTTILPFDIYTRENI